MLPTGSFTTVSGALPTIKSPKASTIVFDTTVASAFSNAIISCSISYKYFEIPAVGAAPVAEKKEFKPFKVGSKGESVKKVQELLGLKADGDFGPGTEKAVKAFQKNSGLPVTGVVDQATLKALRDK